jgi:hypothetical protein
LQPPLVTGRVQVRLLRPMVTPLATFVIVKVFVDFDVTVRT